MGYELNRFISHVDESVKCPICNKVFENPVQLDCVGNEYNQHVFCRSCIIERFASSDCLRCPVDGKQFKRNTRRSLFQTPPQHVFDALSILQIKCAFSTSGCPLILKLTDLDAHADICEYNPYRRIMSTGNEYSEAGFYGPPPYVDPSQTPQHHPAHHPSQPQTQPPVPPTPQQQPQPPQQPQQQAPQPQHHHHHPSQQQTPQYQTWFNEFDAWSMQEPTLQAQQPQIQPPQSIQSKSILETERRLDNKLRILDDKYRQKMEEIKSLYEAKLEESNQEQLQRIEAGYQRDIENLRESNQAHLVRLEEKFRREFDGLRRHWAEKETHKPLKKQKFRHVLEEEVDEEEAGAGATAATGNGVVERDRDKFAEDVGSVLQQEMKKIRKEIHDVWNKNFDEYKKERETEFRKLKNEVGSFLEEMKKNQIEMKRSLGKEIGDLRKSIQEKDDTRKPKMSELKEDYEKQVRDIMCMHLDQIDAIVEKFDKCKEQLKISCKQDIKKLQASVKNQDFQVKKLRQELKGKGLRKSLSKKDDVELLETIKEPKPSSSLKGMDSETEKEEEEQKGSGEEKRLETERGEEENLKEPQNPVRAMPPRGVKRKAGRGRGSRVKRTRINTRRTVTEAMVTQQQQQQQQQRRRPGRPPTGNRPGRPRKYKPPSEAPTIEAAATKLTTASTSELKGLCETPNKSTLEPAQNKENGQGSEESSQKKIPDSLKVKDKEQTNKEKAVNQSKEKKSEAEAEQVKEGREESNHNNHMNGSAKKQKAKVLHLRRNKTMASRGKQLAKKTLEDSNASNKIQAANGVNNEDASLGDGQAKEVADETDKVPIETPSSTQSTPQEPKEATSTTVTPVTCITENSKTTTVTDCSAPSTSQGITVPVNGAPETPVPHSAPTITTMSVTPKAVKPDKTTDLLAQIVNEVILEDSVLNAEIWEQNLLRKPVPPHPDPMAKTVSLYYNFKTDAATTQRIQIQRPTSATRAFDPRIISDIRPATAPPIQRSFTSTIVKPMFENSSSSESISDVIKAVIAEDKSESQTPVVSPQEQQKQEQQQQQQQSQEPQRLEEKEEIQQKTQLQVPEERQERQKIDQSPIDMDESTDVSNDAPTTETKTECRTTTAASKEENGVGVGNDFEKPCSSHFKPNLEKPKATEVEKEKEEQKAEEPKCITKENVIENGSSAAASGKEKTSSLETGILASIASKKGAVVAAAALAGALAGVGTKKGRARGKRVKRRHSAPISTRKKSMEVAEETQLEKIPENPVDESGSGSKADNSEDAQVVGMAIESTVAIPVLSSHKSKTRAKKKFRSKSAEAVVELIKPKKRENKHKSQIEGKSFVIECSPPEKRKRGRPRKGDLSQQRVPALKIRIKDQSFKESKEDPKLDDKNKSEDNTNQNTPPDSEKTGTESRNTTNIPDSEASKSDKALTKADKLKAKSERIAANEKLLESLDSDRSTTTGAEAIAVNATNKRKPPRRRSNDYVKRRRAKRIVSRRPNSLPTELLKTENLTSTTTSDGTPQADATATTDGSVATSSNHATAGEEPKPENLTSEVLFTNPVQAQPSRNVCRKKCGRKAKRGRKPGISYFGRKAVTNSTSAPLTLPSMDQMHTEKVQEMQKGSETETTQLNAVATADDLSAKKPECKDKADGSEEPELKETHTSKKDIAATEPISRPQLSPENLSMHKSQTNEKNEKAQPVSELAATEQTPFKEPSNTPVARKQTQPRATASEPKIDGNPSEPTPESSNSDGYFDNIPNIPDAGSSDLMDINASIPVNTEPPPTTNHLPGIETITGPCNPGFFGNLPISKVIGIGLGINETNNVVNPEPPVLSKEKPGPDLMVSQSPKFCETQTYPRNVNDFGVFGNESLLVTGSADKRNLPFRKRGQRVEWRREGRQTFDCSHQQQETYSSEYHQPFAFLNNQTSRVDHRHYYQQYQHYYIHHQNQQQQELQQLHQHQIHQQTVLRNNESMYNNPYNGNATCGNLFPIADNQLQLDSDAQRRYNINFGQSYRNPETDLPGGSRDSRYHHYFGYHRDGFQSSVMDPALNYSKDANRNSRENSEDNQLPVVTISEEEEDEDESDTNQPEIGYSDNSQVSTTESIDQASAATRFGWKIGDIIGFENRHQESSPVTRFAGKIVEVDHDSNSVRFNMSNDETKFVNSQLTEEQPNNDTRTATGSAPPPLVKHWIPLKPFTISLKTNLFPQ